MSESLINIVLTFVVAIMTVLFVQRLQAKAQFQQAKTGQDKADAEIENANITTALQLLDRVKRENLELSARAASLESISINLGVEVKRLRDDLEEVGEGARKLYYQVKSLNAPPVYTPPNITGPMKKTAG